MEKKFRVTHQFNYSVDNLISKGCASITARLHGAAHADVGYSIYFMPHSVNDKCTGKFLDCRSTFSFENTSCLRRLVRNRMVECFDAITIDAKHLFCFFETLSSFCIFEKALFLDTRDSILETRDSILETRSSNVSSIEARASSLEVRVSSVNLLLSGTVDEHQHGHIPYKSL